jgi:uncharacterized damage-inducible protein DinB
MTVQSVSRLFEYNKWAWRRVFPSLEALSQEEYFAERPFFWNSLHGLAVHGFSSERNWLLRSRDGSSPQPATAGEFPTFAALHESWGPLWDSWQEYLGSLTPTALTSPVVYRSDESEGFSILLDDVLRHVVNHGTEHRSQMTPVLAQLGHPTEPLDLAYFAITDRR